MTSIHFEQLMREHKDTPDHRKYVESLARQHGYILEWDRKIAYAETRCGWREDMQRDREAVRRARARGCF